MKESTRQLLDKAARAIRAAQTLSKETEMIEQATEFLQAAKQYLKSV